MNIPTRALAKVGRELSEPIKILLRTPYEDPKGRGWWSKRIKVELDVEKMRVSHPRNTHLVILDENSEIKNDVIDTYGKSDAHIFHPSNEKKDRHVKLVRSHSKLATVWLSDK